MSTSRSSSSTLFPNPSNGSPSTTKASRKRRIIHDPEVKGELAPYIVADDLIPTVLEYLGGDLKATASSVAKHTLFGRNLLNLMSESKAAYVANLILRGEEKDIEEALDLVKKNPSLACHHVIGTDPRGRRVAGTLLQIAAMAGDVNLKEGIQEEKHRGAVERVIAVAKLSPEEAARQVFDVIGSNEAKEANEKRNQRVMDAIKRLGEGIIRTRETHPGEDFERFKALQIHCKGLIDQFEKELASIFNEVITSGYIFDPKILQDAIKWFEENVARFGDWWSNQSDIFWVNGIGTLQSLLSSRDAQVVYAFIGNLIDHGGNIPPRALNKADGSSYRALDSSSLLGRDFYYAGLCLGTGGGAYGWGVGQGSGRAWKTYVKQKQQRYETYAMPGQSVNACMLDNVGFCRKP